MNTVTYSDQQVKDLLEKHFEHLHLDVVKDKEAVALLDVPAVPVAIVATAGGVELKRLENFIPPDEYARLLRSLVKGE